MPLQFKPGERFAYSNTNYKLLNKIIEQASSKSFEAFLQENILNPLKMKNTGALEKPGIDQPVIKGFADGYTDREGPFERAKWSHPSIGGGIYTTVEDLYLFDQALYTNKLLTKKTMEAAFTPGKGDYGFGWFVYGEAKHGLVMHGGGMPGYSARFARFREGKVTIIILSNLGTASTGLMLDNLAAIMFGEPGRLPPTTAAPSSASCLAMAATVPFDAPVKDRV